MPTVSIIIPAYNAEKTIGRCVESALNQTYTDIEVLVMDDGSRDETPSILDQAAARDERLRVIHKDNTGVSDTRNQALELAEGEYIQFLDADDWITPDATRLFVRAMEESDDCDMVIADFYRVIDDRLSRKGDIEEEKLISRDEYAEYMIRDPADFYYGVLWNKFFRRGLIEDFGIRMDINLSWAEDFIFNMEYILHTRRIYVLKAPVYYYVKTEGSLVSQGISISKTVKMKLNVIEYYRSFYKDIYDSGQYVLRTPAIYSFLLNFAKDGGVNPFVPDGKLGRDRIDVSIAPDMEDNPYAVNYYEDRLLEQAFRRFMNGNDLEEDDAQVLLYLRLAGGTVAMPEIRKYTGLSARALTLSVQKLIRRKIIERVKLTRTKKSPVQALAAAVTDDNIRVFSVPETELRTATDSEDMVTEEDAYRVLGIHRPETGPQEQEGGIFGRGSRRKEKDQGSRKDREENPERSADSRKNQEGHLKKARDSHRDRDENPKKIQGSRKDREENPEKVPDSQRDREKERTPAILTFSDTPEAGLIQDALDRMFRDVRELQLQGFTPEEKALYAQLRSRASRNARLALSETPGGLRQPREDGAILSGYSPGPAGEPAAEMD